MTPWLRWPRGDFQRRSRRVLADVRAFVAQYRHGDMTQHAFSAYFPS